MANGEAKKTLLEKLGIIAQIVIAITAVIGTIFVIVQVNEFINQNNELKKQNKTIQNQTEILGEQLRFSMAPMAVPRSIIVNERETRQGFMNILISYKNELKIGLSFEGVVMNIGSGPMTSIGYLYYLSSDRIDNFWNMIVTGEFQKKFLHFDTRYPQKRGDIYLPGEFDSILGNFEKVDVKDNYYLDVMYLYEDNLGSLYYTIISVGVRIIKNPDKESNKEYLFVDDETTIWKKYRRLSEEERTQIKNKIKELDHPLYNYL